MRAGRIARRWSVVALAAAGASAVGRTAAAGDGGAGSGVVVVSSEVDADAPVVVPGPAGTSINLACNATQCLAAWTVTAGRFDEILAVRVGLDGTVRDPLAIPVLGVPTGSLPAVATDGQDFFLAWSDYRLDSTYGDLYMARVGADGTLLDPGGVVLADGPGSQRGPAAAFNGSEYVVFWSDTRNATPSYRPPAELFTARVRPDGGVSVPPSVVWSARGMSSTSASVVARGDGAVEVAWHDEYQYFDWDDIWRDGAQIRVARMDLDQTFTVRTDVSSWDGYQGRPSVAFGAGEYMVLFQVVGTCVYGYCPRDNYARTLDYAGSPQGYTRPTLARDSTTSQARVASDGTMFLASWRQPTLRLSPMLPTGLLQNSTGVSVVPDCSASDDAYAVASGNGHYLAAWIHDGAVYASRIGSDATQLDVPGFSLSETLNAQSHPALASDGAGGYLAGWLDTRDGAPARVYAARFDASGTLQGSAFAVTFPGVTATEPRVAFDGREYVLLWEETLGGSSQLYAARVDRDGTVLDPAGLRVSSESPALHDARVAGEGGSALVVWTERGIEGPSGGDVVGAFLGSDGIVSPPFAIAEGAGVQDSAAVGVSGGTYLVAWTQDGADVFASRWSADGVTLDAAPLPVAVLPGTQTAPSIDADESGFLVAWQDDRAGAGFDVYATRVGADGTLAVPGGAAASDAPGDQTAPSLAFDGARHWLAWRDTRSGAGVDLFVTRLATDGTALDPAGVALSALPGDESAPSLAGALAAYSRADAPLRSTERVLLRALSESMPDPVDGGTTDDASSDAGAAEGGDDAADPDVTMPDDGGVAEDALGSLDAVTDDVVQPADGGIIMPADDAGSAADDASLELDATVPADDVASVDDTGAMDDIASALDAGVPDDATSAPDSAAADDTAAPDAIDDTPVDAGTPIDVATAHDTSVADDADTTPDAGVSPDVAMIDIVAAPDADDAHDVSTPDVVSPPPDAGEILDAATPTDARDVVLAPDAPDATIAPDAPAADAAPPPRFDATGGCACSVPAAPASPRAPFALSALALATLATRRSRRRRAPL